MLGLHPLCILLCLTLVKWRGTNPWRLWHYALTVAWSLFLRNSTYSRLRYLAGRVGHLTGRVELQCQPAKFLMSIYVAGPGCVTTGNVFQQFHGYQVQDVPRDNNCLFSAIGHQLQLDNSQGLAPTSAQVRAQLVDNLKHNRQLFSDFFCGGSVFRQTPGARDSELETFDEYVKQMESDKTWGDGTMLGNSLQQASCCYLCWWIPKTAKDRHRQECQQRWWAQEKSYLPWTLVFPQRSKQPIRQLTSKSQEWTSCFGYRLDYQFCSWKQSKSWGT